MNTISSGENLLVYFLLYICLAIFMCFLPVIIHMLDFSHYERGSKPKQVLRIDGHLTGPITPDDVNFLLKYNKFFCSRHRQLKEKMVKANITRSIYKACPSPWKCLTTHIRSRVGSLDKEQLFENLRKSIHSSMTCSNLQRSLIFQRRDLLETSSIEQQHAFSGIMASHPLIQEKYLEKIVSESYKDMIIKSCLSPGRMLGLDQRITLEKEIFFFKCPYHGISIGPTNLLLGSLDIVQTRFSVVANWMLQDFFCPGMNILERGIRVINKIESLWDHLGERIFKLLKLWDSYVIGRICADPVEDTGYTELLDYSMDEIKKVLPSFTRSLASTWVPSDERKDLEFALEMSTLARSFGHPCLGEYDSMDKLREKALQYKLVDVRIIKSVRCTFVKTLIKGYISKHKKWPPVVWKEEPSNVLSQVWREGRYPTESEDARIDLEEWDLVDFCKAFEFDYSLDTSELLSDKSCSPPLPYWTQKYDPCGFKILHNQTKPHLPPQETRVMLRYLSGRPGEVKEVIDEIDEGRYDPDNDIVFLTRKERELSDSGRSFCSQTYRQRLVQTACENNIKKHIYSYFPQQTMSDSELSLNKKIASMIRIQKLGGEIFNFDLEKWNQFQRSPAVDPIARDIDRLFGFNHLYLDSHSWIQRSFILLNSRVNPPRMGRVETGVETHMRIDSNGEWKEVESKPYSISTQLPEIGPSCHRDQLGGLEGMKQKLWHNGTSCTFLLASRRKGLRLNLIGCADNQTVAVNYTKYQKDPLNIKNVRESFLEELSDLFEGQGLRLKREETWVSKRLFEYGKRRWFYGLPLNCPTKRATRIMSEESDGIPTFEVSLGMLATGCENVASSSRDPMPSFCLYLIELCIFLHRRKIVRGHRHDEMVLIALCSWPNILGGLIISNLSNFIIRGFDDQLTIWMSIYLHIQEHCPRAFDIICKLIPLEFKSDRNYEHLIEDIFSVNIPSLKTASLAIKDRVKELIPLFTSNREVLSVLELNTNDTGAIVQQIISMNPFYAPLAHELFRNSNAGTIKQLQSKLTNVQSIVKIARSFDDNDLYSEIEAADYTLIGTLIRRVSDLVSDKSHQSNNNLVRYLEDKCSYIASRKIRTDGWGFEPLGASHPVPWEQFSIHPFEAINEEDYSRSITVRIDQDAQNPESPPDCLGPYPIYLGSVTHTKSASSRIKFLNTTPFTETIKNLLGILAWAQKTKSLDLEDMVMCLLESKKTLLPEGVTLQNLVAEVPGIYSGHLFHRLHTITESQGAIFNTLPYLSSYIRFSTGTLSEITKEGKDYNIFFQMVFLYTATWLADRFVTPKESETAPELRLLLACRGCTHILQDHEIRMTSEPDPSRLPDTKESMILAYRNVPLEKLKTAFSLAVGADMAEDIRNAMMAPIGDASMLGEIKSVDSYSKVNVVELRDCDLISAIMGCFIHSRQLRLSILSEHPVNLSTSPNFLCQPIIQSITKSGRLGELLNIFGGSPSSGGPNLDVKELSRLVWEGIRGLVLDSSELLPAILKLFLRENESDPISDHVGGCLKALVIKEYREIKKALDIINLDIIEKQHDLNVSKSFVLTGYILTENDTRHVDFKREVEALYPHIETFSLDREEIDTETRLEVCDRCERNIADREGFPPTEEYGLKGLVGKRMRIRVCGDHATSSTTLLVVYTPTLDDYKRWKSLLPTLWDKYGSDIMFRCKRSSPKLSLTTIPQQKIELEKLEWQRLQVLSQFKSTKKALELLTHQGHNPPASFWREIGRTNRRLSESISKREFQGVPMVPYEIARLIWRSNYVGKLKNIPDFLSSTKSIRADVKEVCLIPTNIFCTTSDTDIHAQFSFRTGHRICQEDSSHACTTPYGFEHFSSNICKPMGQLNSSSNSLIMRWLKGPSMDSSSVGMVINLAGGSGTDFQLLCHLCPESDNIFSSLIHVGGFDPADIAYPIPAAILGDPCIDSIAVLSNSTYLIHGVNDITNSEMWAKVSHVIDNYEEKNPTNKTIIIQADLEVLDLNAYLGLMYLVDLILSRPTDNRIWVLFTMRLAYPFLMRIRTLITKYPTEIQLPRPDPQFTGLVRLSSTNKPSAMIPNSSRSLNLLDRIEQLIVQNPCTCTWGYGHMCFHSQGVTMPSTITEGQASNYRELVITAIKANSFISHAHKSIVRKQCPLRKCLKDYTHNPLTCQNISLRISWLLNMNKEHLDVINPALCTMISQMGKKGQLIHILEELLIILSSIECMKRRVDPETLRIFYNILLTSHIRFHTDWRLEDGELKELSVYIKTEQREGKGGSLLMKRHRGLIRDCILILMYGGGFCLSGPFRSDHYKHIPVPLIKGTNWEGDRLVRRRKLESKIRESVSKLVDRENNVLR